MGIPKINKMNTFLVIVMMIAIFLCFSGQVNAAQAGDYTYTVTDGQAQITGYTGAGRNVAVPNALDQVHVTSIGAGAFVNNRSMTSISIPAGVKIIGQGAFAGCRSLTDISVDVKNLDYASLDGILFDKAGTTLKACPGGLTSISIPPEVTSIDDYAFRGCKSLTDIIIPAGVTSIGEAAFRDCTGLITISIPSGVTSIGDYAFVGCRSLTGISVDVNNLKYAGRDGLLLDKAGTILIACPAGLTVVSIPPGVTSIGVYAFNGCRGLTSIMIPPGVTSIGDTAFHDCTGLTTISIPSGVTSIGRQAFTGCSSLTSILVDANNLNYASITGVLFNKAGTTLIACPGGLTNFGIPSGTTSIGAYAFEECTFLTSIIIPPGVTSIGGAAFRYCTGLTAIGLPPGLASIGPNAFNGCTGLSVISIPARVSKIGQSAFYGCTGITRITFNSAKTVITDDPGTIPEAAKVVGYDPSTAKDYAAKYNRTFEEIGTITVKVNGTPLVFDQPPVSTNNRILVPLRAIFEALGATVNWDGATQEVTATKGDKTIVVKIGSQQAIVNGASKYLDVPAQSMNNRTLVPVRFISESLGAKVVWDDPSQTVIITE